jgi:hypothetical protein
VRIVDHPLLQPKQKPVVGMRALAPGTLATAKARSQNEKLGSCATTYAEQRSCPVSCVFFDGGGCYAEDGPVGKFVTQPLNRAAQAREATPEDIAQAEADAIDALQVPEPGWPMRLHTVGDCKTDEAARIVAAAARRWVERGGGPVWTYTHAWQEVQRASWGLVHVLASCETPEDVQQAEWLGYATAITVKEFPGRKLYRIKAEFEEELLDDERTRVIPCPAQTTEGVSCSSCRLCMDSDRLREQDLTIGFAIHGTPLLRRRARLALERPDDPNRKRSLRELIPEFEVSFEAEHGRLPTNPECAREFDCDVSSVWEMRKSLRTGQPARPPRRQGRRHGR